MDHVVVEAGTKPSLDFSGLFFDESPNDARFTSTAFHEFTPIDSIVNADTVKFCLPAWDSTNVYLLDQMMIKIKVKLVDAAGAAPAAATLLFPSQNVLQTTFSDVKLRIGQYLVNGRTANYPYKVIYVVFHEILQRCSVCSVLLSILINFFCPGPHQQSHKL